MLYYEKTLKNLDYVKKLLQKRKTLLFRLKIKRVKYRF